MSEITIFGWMLLGLTGVAGAGFTALLMRVYGSGPEALTEEEKEWRESIPRGFRIALELAEPFQGVLARITGPRQREYVRARLSMAGLSFAMRPEDFIAARVVGFAAGIVFYLVLFFMLDLGATSATFLFFIAAVVGTFYPDIVLRDRIAKRRKQIEKAFPFFLDLIVLSLRAGLTFTIALQQSVRKLPRGPLRLELSRTLNDMRAGMPRSQALTDMADRMRIPAVGNFAAAVNQAEETGAAIASALEVQADQRRQERFLEAERLGNQAPVKLLFPLVFFLFPLTFLIIFFPIVVEIYQSGGAEFFR